MIQHSEELRAALDPPVCLVVDDPSSEFYGTRHFMTQSELEDLDRVLGGTIA